MDELFFFLELPFRVLGTFFAHDGEPGLRQLSGTVGSLLTPHHAPRTPVALPLQAGARDTESGSH